MTNKNKSKRSLKIEEDGFFEATASNKLFIFTFLLLALSAKIVSRTVLNEPRLITYLKCSLPLIMYAVFFYKRYILYPEYYKCQMKDIAGILTQFFALLFFGTFFWMILYVVIGVSIISVASTNNIEIFNCKISTITTVHEDKLLYVFKGHNYVVSLEDDHGKSPSELRKHYFIQIDAKRSVLDSYVLESFRLVQKKYEITYE